MAITASEITTSNTLEQFRQQFNNLITDVIGLETGTQTFTSLNATNVNVVEDGVIIFEGATDDEFETTLTVVDPTADRTITLPNETGTVLPTASTITSTSVNVSANNTANETVFPVFVDGTTGSQELESDSGLSYNPSTELLTVGKLLLDDGATIGVASSTSAITVASTGIVTFVDDIVIKDGGTIGSSTTGGAITIASTGVTTFSQDVQVDDLLVRDGGHVGTVSDTDALSITSTGQVDIDNQLAIGNSNFTSILSANGESTGTGVGMTLRAGTDNSGVGGNAIVFGLYVGRAANSTYTFLACGAGTTNADSTLSDPTHKLLGNGATNADGAYSSTGADYAEMFEWEDGNSSNEDRVGYTVVLSGNKIRKSTSDDSASSIIGVVSSRPVILGDNDIDSWKGRWLTDDFGRRVMESHTLTEWTDSEGNKVNYETDNIPSDVTPPSDAVVRTKDDDGQTLQRKKVNPSFDPSKTYERREDRKEWDAIGLMGKLRVRKGQDVGDRWIKMRDVSDSVEEYLVR